MPWPQRLKEAAEEAGRCLAFSADPGEAAVELAESRDRGGGARVCVLNLVG